MLRTPVLVLLCVGLGLALVGCEEDEEDPIFLGAVSGTGGYVAAPPYAPGKAGAAGSATAGAGGSVDTVKLAACSSAVEGPFRGLAASGGGWLVGGETSIRASSDACAATLADAFAVPGAAHLAVVPGHLFVARAGDLVDVTLATSAQKTCPGVSLRGLAPSGALALGVDTKGQAWSFAAGGCGEKLLSSSKIVTALAAAGSLTDGTAWVSGLDASGALLVRRVVLSNGGDAGAQPVATTGLCSADALAETTAGLWVLDGACRKVRLVPLDGAPTREATVPGEAVARGLVPGADGVVRVVLAGGTSFRLATLSP